MRPSLLISVALLAGGCGSPSATPTPQPTRGAAAALLPTGVLLDPATKGTELGSFPLAMVPSPEGDRIVVLLNGWREQGVQVVSRASGEILQTLIQPAACLGLAFSPDGKWLFASGGNQDVVYRYAWSAGRATLRDSLVLATRVGKNGTRYPAGLAPSTDGRTLYVAENLADSLAVIDLATGRVSQRLPAGRYPYGVAVARDGTVYVSAWGDRSVAAYTRAADGMLAAPAPIAVGRHPSALLLNGDDSRLFVASASTDRVSVVDTRSRHVITEILDSPPGGPGEGSTPNALALSRDGTRLYIAEADNNAVAVVDLSSRTSGTAAAAGPDTVVGRLPTDWYPAAVLASADTLLVVSAKGHGAGPNPHGPTPYTQDERIPRQYTLGQLSGSLGTFTLARANASQLAPFSRRVAAANHWDIQRTPGRYPPIDHVIYVIKENRTFDQVLGDLPNADGDTSLVLFPRAVTPNHHALAERFGTYDRFLVSAEVSGDGHNWSMAAYATDYVEKTVQQYYSQRGRTYDFEGTNRDKRVDDDDAAEPAAGYLWDLARRKGITFRTYGEFTLPQGRLERTEQGSVTPAGAAAATAYRGVRPYVDANANHEYPSFDTRITDQHRTDIWVRELGEFSRRGTMPTLQIVRLPNDHTAGAHAGDRTPRAMVADNDLALGRMIEALSRSPFWKSTAVFVLEDDAQNGPDHVDSHRSLLYVISPYSRPGVHHRFANTTDVIATIEELLGLGTLSQFDHFGRPLRDVFAMQPDLRAYSALVPAVNLSETNPARGHAERLSRTLDLADVDRADDDLLNRILWIAVKGDAVPYPGSRRMTARDIATGLH